MSTATLSVDSRMDASKQRTLIQRHPIASVLILAIAVPESLFHLPYFFNKNVAFYQNIGPIAFTAFTVALTILFVLTRTHRRSNKNECVV